VRCSIRTVIFRASWTCHSSQGPNLGVEPTPNPVEAGKKAAIKARQTAADGEAEIDILYQNERGGFLCGIALFSSKALGNLDPAPWTNRYHKPSPTDIHTAQVPDPSWQWAWPEWRINHDEGVDQGGWEYSFMFSKKFSWHGAKWWNSFVRRRAWIRRRVKKLEEEVPSDPHMLNTEYFDIRPASQASQRSRSHSRGHSRSASATGSMLGSRASTSRFSKGEWLDDGEPQEIESVEVLLGVLRRARIDREKLEAVDNYLEHADQDLVHLRDEMGEIMRLFVFQASRKLLLAHLTHTLDTTIEELGREDSPRLRERREHLAAAIREADEEVRKLAYWSDVKEMVEKGESKGAVDEENGWSPEDWQGVDQSGPAAPGGRKLP
jgi:hypothetical protein